MYNHVRLEKALFSERVGILSSLSSRREKPKGSLTFAIHSPHACMMAEHFLTDTKSAKNQS